MEGSDLSIQNPGMAFFDEAIRRRAHVEPLKADADERQRIKTAKDFESIFVHQLMDAMKNTIPESDMEDASSEQIKGMFWSFLSEAVADQGGLGLWKEIYRQMSGGSGAYGEAQSLDGGAGEISELNERI